MRSLADANHCGVTFTCRERKQLKVLAAFGNSTAKQITGCEISSREHCVSACILVTISLDLSALADDASADDELKVTCD
jgi:hypothetical protein